VKKAFVLIFMGKGIAVLTEPLLPVIAQGIHWYYRRNMSVG
jgi:hypothetical protein